jgi:MFS family permease
MGTQFRAALTVVRRPVVAASIAFGFVLFALVFGLFLTTLSLHLDNEFGLEAGGRGLIIAAPATGATVAALSLGRMRARFGGARLLLAANALFVIGFCAIGTAPSIWVLIGGAVLYGLGEGTAIPTVQDIVAGAAPTESRGAVVALWVGSARAGQTVGPLMAGAGIATVGTGATFVAGGLVAAGLLVAQLTVPVRRLEAEAGLRSAP